MVPSLGWEDPLEEETANHSSTLAWRIPWTEEPGGLQSMRSRSQTRLGDYVQFSGLPSDFLGGLVVKNLPANA